jgi:hypothetical protein
VEREIDRLVYQLYDLTSEEIAVVEESTRASGAANRQIETGQIWLTLRKRWAVLRTVEDYQRSGSYQCNKSRPGQMTPCRHARAFTIGRPK